MKPSSVAIEYCPKCGWLLRAAYMAQELLTTFADELGAITLKPGEIAGYFTITVKDEIVFDRKKHGGFAEIKELKQLVHDVMTPQKSLSHSDKQL